VVAHSGSISAAARSLGWTPPAVSQHVAALEGVLGVPLIHRHRSGIELTEAGRIVVDHAEAINLSLDTAYDEVMALARRDHGTVRMACFASGLTCVMPRVLEQLRAEPGPDVEVRLTETHPKGSLELLRAGEVDVALVFDYVNARSNGHGNGHSNGNGNGMAQLIPPDLQGVPCGGDQMTVLLSTRHPAVNDPNLKLADLAPSKWITGCDICRQFLSQAAASAGFQPRVVHQTHDVFVIKSLVSGDSSGMTVAWVPTTLLPAFPDDSLITRHLPELPRRSFVALCRPGADAIPAIGRVLDVLQRVGRAELGA
jgi:DNA-binding transcriptional LysR family regulator